MKNATDPARSLRRKHFDTINKYSIQSIATRCSSNFPQDNSVKMDNNGAVIGKYSGEFLSREYIRIKPQ